MMPENRLETSNTTELDGANHLPVKEKSISKPKPKITSSPLNDPSPMSIRITAKLWKMTPREARRSLQKRLAFYGPKTPIEHYIWSNLIISEFQHYLLLESLLNSTFPSVDNLVSMSDRLGTNQRKWLDMLKSEDSKEGLEKHIKFEYFHRTPSLLLENNEQKIGQRLNSLTHGVRSEIIPQLLAEEFSALNNQIES